MNTYILESIRAKAIKFADHSDQVASSRLQYPSKAGFSALANKMPRLPPLRLTVGPPAGRYEPTPWILRAGYTFDKYVLPESKWLTPG